MTNDALFSPETVPAAVAWVQATLTGTMATAVAIISVAVIGLQLLVGKIDLNRGGRTILGCFLIFGAPAIADGLLSMTNTASAQAGSESRARRDSLPAPVPAASPLPADPYAGASIMPR